MGDVNFRHASRCEQGEGDVCRCSCGGTLHGAYGSRKGGGQSTYTADDENGKRQPERFTIILDRAFFESLPADDPHHIVSDADRQSKKDADKAEERRGYDAIQKVYYDGGRDLPYSEYYKAQIAAVLAAYPAMLAEGGQFAKGVMRWMRTNTTHEIHIAVGISKPKSCYPCQKEQPS